jgi:cardiolipin synthase C
MKRFFSLILAVLLSTSLVFSGPAQDFEKVGYLEAIGNLNDQYDLVLPLFSQRESYQSRIDLALHPDNKQLDVLTFTLAEDTVGFSLLAAAIEVVRRGGQARIGYDAFSSKVSPELQAYMREKGVDLRAYRPLGFKVKDFFSFFKMGLGLLGIARFLNMRTHDKVFITKHGIVVGSSNYSKYYYILGKKEIPDKKDRFDAWSFLDREILIQGPAEVDAREEFEKKWADTEFWSTGSKEVKLTDELRNKFDLALEKQRQFIVGVQGSKNLKDFVRVENLEYVTDKVSRQKKQKNIHNRILEMINSAQTEIVIENPYVLLTDDVFQALVAAKKRGVRVKIYTNKAGGSDEGDVGKQFKVDLRRLENTGFEVMLNESFYIFHGKVVVVDKKHIYWGSYNFDSRSKNFNSENGVFFSSAEIASRIESRTQSGIFVPVDVVGQGKKSYKVVYLARSCQEVYGKRKVETITLPDGRWEKLIMKLKEPLL